MNRPPLTPEQIAAVRHDATFTRDRVGAPGSPIRQVAEATLQALDERAELIATLIKALDELGSHFRSDSLVQTEFEAEMLLRRIGAIP
jgi:hypothetical protein